MHHIQNENESIFNSTQLSTLELINSLINANDTEEAQAFLQQFYDNTPSHFIQTLLSIINKYLTNNIGVESNKQVYCVLLYLRHFINMQNHKMPDFTKQFSALYRRINNKNSRDLLVDCIQVYLTKSQHKSQLKDYLHQISFNLMQQIQKNTVDQIYLRMIVQTLENLSQSKDYRPGLAVESEAMIKSIISRYGTKKPLNIDADLWVWTIITLSTYTKFVPSVQFICVTLNKQGYSAKMYGKLFAIMNKMHHLFGSVEQVYQILQGQLKRLLNREFIAQLEQECGVQGLQTFVKSVVYLIKYSFSLISQSSTSDINQFMLFQFFKQYSLFQTSLLGVLQIVKQHHHDYSQFFYLLTLLLQQFSQFLQENVMLNYASQIKHKVSGQYMYCLLSGLPRNCLQIFGATGLLLQNINYILQNRQTVNIKQRKTMRTMELFLQFILHYLDVNHFLENQNIGVTIYKFVNQFIALLPQNSPNAQSHEQILKIKAYGISLLISMQKFNPHPDNNKISTFLQIVYGLMAKVISASSAQQSEIISICVEGLGYLKFIGAYKQTLSDCIINFFTTQLGTDSKFDSNQHYIFLQFLKVLYDCYEIQIKQQNQSLVSLIYILKWFIETRNKSMQDQASQFILKILYSINSLFAQNKPNQSCINGLLFNIYETGVYAYIKQSFLKDDEDFLYCKILMETLIHKSGSKLVEDILKEACSTPESYQISHNFDKVWQALVILYEVRNQYTQKRLINQRIENIMGGSLEALLLNMSLDEQNEYKRKSNKMKNKRIRWSWLPEVRKVLEAGSYVGYYVEYKLNNGDVERE